MKRILYFTLFHLFLSSSVFAQEPSSTSDSAYLARCRYFRESLIETGREFKAQTKERDCAEMDALIDEILAIDRICKEAYSKVNVSNTFSLLGVLFACF